MADEVKLIDQLGSLPEPLSEAYDENGGISVFSTCLTDSSDCANDDPSCTSDSAACGVDVCTWDGGCYDSCSSDCSDTVVTVEPPSYYVSEVTSSTVTLVISNPDNCYIRIFVRLSSSSSGLVDSWIGTSSSYTRVVSGLSPKTTYVVNVGYKTDSSSNVTTWTGATTFTTEAKERPDDWAWWSTVAKGSAIAITASEWNSFCGRINEFRSYMEMSTYAFTTITSGYLMYAWVVNQAITAIDAIDGHGTLPDKVSSGDKITASFFNKLKTALNSIP